MKWFLSKKSFVHLITPFFRYFKKSLENVPKKILQMIPAGWRIAVVNNSGSGQNHFYGLTISQKKLIFILRIRTNSNYRACISTGAFSTNTPSIKLLTVSFTRTFKSIIALLVSGWKVNLIFECCNFNL